MNAVQTSLETSINFLLETYYEPLRLNGFQEEIIREISRRTCKLGLVPTGNHRWGRKKLAMRCRRRRFTNANSMDRGQNSALVPDQEKDSKPGLELILFAVGTDWECR